MTSTQVSRRDRIVLVSALFGGLAILTLLTGPDAWFLGDAYSWWNDNQRNVRFAVEYGARAAKSLIQIVDGLATIYGELA